jgi:hypothetical protein
MSDTLMELKEKAARLSDTERAELALSLIESLDGPADPMLKRLGASKSSAVSVKLTAAM